MSNTSTTPEKQRGPRFQAYLLPAIMAFVLLGLLWTPHDPGDQSFRAEALAGPSAAHWLGVDPLGRDVLSRVWRGAANSVLLGGAAMLLGATGGLLLVLLAEGLGKRVAATVQGLIGLWVAVPVIFLGLLLLVFLPPGPGALIWAAALGIIPLAFRQMRVMWREQAGALYWQASQALGARGWTLLRYTAWPALAPQLGALARLLFAICVLELSGLAFLGLLGDPDFPELGAMLRQYQAFLHSAPLLLVWPGAVLVGLLALVHQER